MNEGVSGPRTELVGGSASTGEKNRGGQGVLSDRTKKTWPGRHISETHRERNARGAVLFH